MKLNEVEDDFTPIEEGSYNAEVVDVEKKQAKTGNWYLNWQFEILEGDFKGRSVWDTTVLLPNSLWKLKKYIKTLVKKDLPEDEYRDLLDMEVGTEEFLQRMENLKGKKLRLDIGQRTYTDKNDNERTVADVVDFDFVSIHSQDNDPDLPF